MEHVTGSGVTDAADAVSSAVRVGQLFAARADKLAAVCQQAGEELQAAYVDCELTKDLGEEDKAVAELFVAWKEVGESLATFATRMAELSTSVRHTMTEAEKERCQRLAESTRLLESLATAEATGGRGPTAKQGWFGFLGSQAAEPERDEEADRRRLEGQQSATAMCIEVMQEQVRVAGKRAAMAIHESCGEARRHAKVVGEKVIALKPSWRGSAGRGPQRSVSTPAGDRSGPAAAKGVGGLVRSLSTAQGRQKLQEEAKAAPGVDLSAIEEAPMLSPPVQRGESDREWRIRGVYSHQVLKAGLRRLDELWPAEGLQDFPRGKDGSAVLLRERLFRQLLSGEIRLQSVSRNDVSAGQRDVKQLSLRQLLRLRVLHIDFTPSGAGANSISTVGDSHEAFLSTLDSRLFHHLGRKAIKELATDGHVAFAESDMHKLGREAVLFASAASAVPSPVWWCWWITAQRRVFFDAAGFTAVDAFPDGNGGVLEITDHSRPDKNDPSGSLRWLDWRCYVVLAEIDLAATPSVEAGDASASDSSPGKNGGRGSVDEAFSPEKKAAQAATANMFSPDVLKGIRGNLKKTGGPGAGSPGKQASAKDKGEAEDSGVQVT